MTQAQLPDDGSGSLRVWRVRTAAEPTGAPLVELERAQAAAFYGGDCYLVLYTYHAPTGDNTMLYYWMVSIIYRNLYSLYIAVKRRKDRHCKWIRQTKDLRKCPCTYASISALFSWRK